MMKYITTYLFVCLALLSSWEGLAQSTLLKGSVQDTDGKALELVTIRLVYPSGQVVGDTSDKEGQFSLRCPRGKVSLTVSMVGYKSIHQQVTIDEGEQSLAPFVLEEQTRRLESVTVTAKRPLLRREVDRIVLDASQLSKTTSNAVDLLKVTPGLLVSDEGLISMFGKGAVIVLINGREKRMSQQELGVLLRSYRSEDIASIEVMMTPPAKYTAEGNAGVVNILLKARTSDYLGGTLGTDLVLARRYAQDLSASLSYVKGRTNLSLNAFKGLGNRQIDKESELKQGATLLRQSERIRQDNNFLLLRGELEHRLSDKVQVGSQVAYTYLAPDRKSSYTFDNLVTGETMGGRDMNRLTASAFLSANWKGKKSMSVELDYFRYTLNEDNAYRRVNDLALAFAQDNRTDREVNLGAYRVDFKMPVASLSTSFGFGGSYTHINNDFREARPLNLHDKFRFTEWVNALYTDAMLPIGAKVVAKVGLRAELTHTKGESLLGSSLGSRSSSYIDLFPSVFVRYTPSRTKVWTLNYARRLDRPKFATLNPFARQLDERTVRIGNPYLSPAYVHSAELAYTHRNNWTTSLSYRVQRGVFREVQKLDVATNVLRYTYDNVQDLTFLILSSSYRWTLSKRAALSASAYGYRMWSETDKAATLLKDSRWNYLLWGQLQLELDKSKQWIAELDGQMMGREQYAESSTEERFYANLSLRYQTPNKKLNVVARVRSLLGNNLVTRYADGILEGRYMTETVPTFQLSLSYRFGKNMRAKRYDNRTLVNRLSEPE